MTQRHSLRSRLIEGERRRRLKRTGTEPVTAKSVSLRLKTWLALGSFILALSLGIIASINSFTVTAILLFIIAAISLIDLGWVIWKWRNGLFDE